MSHLFIHRYSFLHDALPISASPGVSTTVETDHPHGDDHVTLFTCQPPALAGVHSMHEERPGRPSHSRARVAAGSGPARSEEHTSELQPHVKLVCRLLLEENK